MVGGTCQSDFLAKVNIVRRDAEVSHRRGNITPSERYRKAVGMI